MSRGPDPGVIDDDADRAADGGTQLDRPIDEDRRERQRALEPVWPATRAQQCVVQYGRCAVATVRALLAAHVLLQYRARLQLQCGGEELGVIAQVVERSTTGVLETLCHRSGRPPCKGHGFVTRTPRVPECSHELHGQQRDRDGRDRRHAKLGRQRQRLEDFADVARTRPARLRGHVLADRGVAGGFHVCSANLDFREPKRVVT